MRAHDFIVAQIDSYLICWGAEPERRAEIKIRIDELRKVLKYIESRRDYRKMREAEK